MKCLPNNDVSVLVESVIRNPIYVTKVGEPEGRCQEHGQREQHGHVMSGAKVHGMQENTY